MNTTLDFGVSEPFNEENIAVIRSAASSGLLEQLQLVMPIEGRLSYILENDRYARTGDSDNVLIETVAKYMGPVRYPKAYSLMLHIVLAQCSHYAVQNLESKMIDVHDWWYFFNIMASVIVSKMAAYDSEIHTPVQHLRPYIINAFFVARTGYSVPAMTIRALALDAMKAQEPGTPHHPDYTEIAERINETLKLYKPVTAFQVQHAFEMQGRPPPEKPEILYPEEKTVTGRYYRTVSRQELFCTASGII